MARARRSADDAPFYRSAVEGKKARRALRAEAERWAVARGYAVVDEGLRLPIEGVEVDVVFSPSVAEMCTLRSRLGIAEAIHLEVEPRSWGDRIVARLRDAFVLGDEAFDGRWHVATDNEAVALTLLLDARVRWALDHHSLWCRLVLGDGVVEVVVDAGSDRLTGAHLLAAAEVVVATALAVQRAAPSFAPYR